MLSRRPRGPVFAALAACAVLACLVRPAPAQTVLYRCTDADDNLTIQNDPCPAGTQERRQVIGELPEAPSPRTPSPQPSLPADALPEQEWQLPPLQDGPSTDTQEIPILAPIPGPAPVMPTTGPADIPLPGPGQPIVRERPLEVITDTRETEYRILDSGTPPAERDPVPTIDPAAEASAELPPPPPALQACRGWDNEIRYSEAEEPPRRCMPLQTVGLGGMPGIGSGTACEMVSDTCAAVPDGQLCDAWLRRLRDEQAKLVFARSDDPAATRAEIERIEDLLKASSCGPAR